MWETVSTDSVSVKLHSYDEYLLDSPGAEPFDSDLEMDETKCD